MYNGDGRDDESSSCRYVGIDIGGRGMDCGIGDGGSIAEGFNVPFAGGLTLLRSKGSGRPLDGIGFRFGDW
jgi:hypothetical protein